MTDHETRAPGAFFGRRKGRPLREQQVIARETGLARYGLELTQPAPANLKNLFESPVDAVRLEIGFGGGEHLLHRARENPKVGFIGVEPFINGMSKLLAALAREPLGNVRVYDQDAIHVLDWVPEVGLAEVDLFYPDPWPKKKHWKRRFVSQANLDRIARVLKPGGLFHFASDIDTYVNWTLLHCRSHEAFEWQATSSADWNAPYDGWPGTRYEAKALREGRRAAYLTFKKV
ncbi:MAG: tRNA (guanosine(46)-N(7))-methyltransferase TrmB [Rhizobiaceae bacterium]